MILRPARRLGSVLAATAGLVLVTGTVASAHECFIANRSDQGDAAAGANSQAWFTLVVADGIQSDVGTAYDQATADCIIDAYAATGAPASFTFHVKGVVGQDGVLADHNPNDIRLMDGHGVDHAFDVYGDAIFGSFAQCGVSFEE